MAITYQNRRGDTYHLLVGKTKTGKPKYYVSKKSGENTVDILPDGYEIYESPENAQVHVRKIRSTAILPFERELVVAGVQKATGRSHFFVEADGDYLLIYWPATDPAAVDSMFGRLLGATSVLSHTMAEWTRQQTRYEPLMRFVLVQAEDRQFVAERMCYRGGGEFWLDISSRGELAQLVAEYTPHLGQESYFDLMRY